MAREEDVERAREMLADPGLDPVERVRQLNVPAGRRESERGRPRRRPSGSSKSAPMSTRPTTWVLVTGSSATSTPPSRVTITMSVPHGVGLTYTMGVSVAARTTSANSTPEAKPSSPGIDRISSSSSCRCAPDARSLSESGALAAPRAAARYCSASSESTN